MDDLQFRWVSQSVSQSRWSVQEMLTHLKSSRMNIEEYKRITLEKRQDEHKRTRRRLKTTKGFGEVTCRDHQVSLHTGPVLLCAALACKTWKKQMRAAFAAFSQNDVQCSPGLSCRKLSARHPRIKLQPNLQVDLLVGGAWRREQILLAQNVKEVHQ